MSVTKSASVLLGITFAFLVACAGRADTPDVVPLDTLPPVEEVEENEIYARHGRRFRTPALQRHFDGRAWYRPTGSYAEPRLSAVERRNVALIQRVEAARGGPFRW